MKITISELIALVQLLPVPTMAGEVMEVPARSLHSAFTDRNAPMMMEARKVCVIAENVKDTWGIDTLKWVLQCEVILM